MYHLGHGYLHRNQQKIIPMPQVHFNQLKQEERGRAQTLKEWHSHKHDRHWLEPTRSKMTDLTSSELCQDISPEYSLEGLTDAEAKTPILWPPDATNWLLGKDLKAGKDWRQKEKRTTEDEMAGWHHQLDEHEVEQARGVGDRQGSLACCGPWGGKELDVTEQLNWSELNPLFSVTWSCWTLWPHGL